MISVVVPTRNSELELAHCLSALVPAAAEGVVREVIVVDAGSTDGTARVADAAGCDFVNLPDPRGARMSRGASSTRRGAWLLFLPAGTVLDTGWHAEASAFIERAERSGQADTCAAVFRLQFDGFGTVARISERLAWLRARVFAMPCGEQGLLISRRHYEELGGHRPVQEMEDIELLRRIGLRKVIHLRTAAICRMSNTSSGILGSFRRAAARFCVAILRLPPKAVLKLHG